jgi:3-oxoadipate enol-lactonase
MDAFLELLLSFSQLDITADLHRISAPALVMVGEEDILKPRKYAEIIARELPNSEFAIVPHAGHAVLWEQAPVFNSLILGFMAKQAHP